MISPQETIETLYLEPQRKMKRMEAKKIPEANKSSFVDTRPDWDEWFMGMCFVASLRSPDQSTKHGAVLSNEHHQILGIGYNGFIRGSKDNEMPQTRPLKYLYLLHAEVNCILNSQNLLCGNNYTMHITGMPCPNCFLQIAQSKIKRVVYGSVTSRCVDEGQMNIVNDLAQDHCIELIQFDLPSNLVEMLEKYHYIKGTRRKL